MTEVINTQIDEKILLDVDYKLLAEKEKKARIENEISLTANLCVELLNLVWTRYGHQFVSTVFMSLSRKRNQSKRSQTDMIKLIFEQIYPTVQNQQSQISLLKSLIEITEGKIYVEYEYSVAIKKLTEIYLLQGNIDEATKLIQDIQIETFGSLERIYKVDYILFQMKVLLQKGDFVRTLIVSNKIVRRHLDEKGLENLKIVFYLQMARYYNHEENFFESSKCYQIIYDFIVYLKKNFEKYQNNIDLIQNLTIVSENEIFEKFVYLLNISLPNQATKEKILEISKTYVKELEENPQIGQLIKIKTGDELVQIENDFLMNFNNSTFVDNKEYFIYGSSNSHLFRKYLIQHNIDIFRKFYSQVQLERISELIKVDVLEVEAEICDMVMNKLIYARINRIKSVVQFRPKQTVEKKSDTLNDDLTKMLDTLETTCHLIHKENLKHGIKTK